MGGVSKFNSVEEYFNAQTEKSRKVLVELRNCILKIVPNATELLNYNIPAYSLVEGGKREHQIMIAGNKTSVGFYPHPTTVRAFDKELIIYKKGKGSVQFPLNNPLPKNLIERMVAYRFELLTK